MFLAPIVAHVGIDPSKDNQLGCQPVGEADAAFIDGKLDGFLGLPPEPQELHARRVGHVIVNSTVDRPWSQYFLLHAGGPSGIRTEISDRDQTGDASHSQSGRFVRD